MSDSRSKSNEADWGLAGFDFTKLVESCQIGGVDMSSGPRTSASPAIHASQVGMASASLRENFAISSWFRFASSWKMLTERPSGNAW